MYVSVSIYLCLSVCSHIYLSSCICCHCGTTISKATVASRSHNHDLAVVSSSIIWCQPKDSGALWLEGRTAGLVESNGILPAGIDYAS